MDGDAMTCTTHHNACACRQRAIDANLGRLLLSDLRYSMGRPTAAPDDCSRGIRQLWHMADAEWRALVLRDLREYVARRARADDVCLDVWTELLAWMEEQR